LIARAAIRAKDGKVYSLSRPARHGDVMAMLGTIETEHGAKWALHDGEQGFLDDTGMFLTRKEALHHATICGQLKKPLIGSILTSEDLW
jgi:hypothetical protein